MTAPTSPEQIRAERQATAGLWRLITGVCAVWVVLGAFMFVVLAGLAGLL